MAKRKTPNLFDNLDAGGPDNAAANAAARKGLVGGDGHGPGSTADLALHEAAQARHLNYPLSLITARALPDLRPAPKPAQRRLLYTLGHQTPTAAATHPKSAPLPGALPGS